MREFFAALMLLALPVSASAAGDDIYFQLANDKGSYNFINTSPLPIPPMLRNAAMLTLDKPYAHNLVQMQYYQLTITHGIVWNGEKIVQYDYTPINNDRFRHVIWLNKERTAIFKAEIYDTDNRLMYSALCLNKPFPVNDPVDAYMERLDTSKFSFFGFSNINEQYFENGGLKILFTDGLNRFSVFRSMIGPKSPQPHEEIIYGNLVYSKDVDGYTYTVVGTIPFEAMDNFIDRVDAVIKEKAAVEASEKANAPPVKPKDSPKADSPEELLDVPEELEPAKPVQDIDLQDLPSLMEDAQ